MPNLDELKGEVAQLNDRTSIKSDFDDVFGRIREASRTLTRAERSELRDILSAFRQKLPDLITYEELRADAKALAERIMLDGLGDSTKRIAARNEALAGLTSALNAESKKARRDADLLKQIKEAAEKGTKTVAEIKELIGRLTETDAGTKGRLVALVESLGDIKDIFDPEEEEEGA